MNNAESGGAISPVEPSSSTGVRVSGLTRTRKVLLSLLALGALAAVGAGTLASFNAQTSNSSNTFQTGTITLSNQNQAAVTCWSTGTAGGLGTFNNGNSQACDAIVATGNVKPGAATQTTVITVATAGSLTPSSVTLAVACASANVAASANGNGNLCDWMGLTIQQCAAVVTTATCGGAGVTASCVFPFSAGVACPANPTVAGGPPPTSGDLTAAVAASPITLAAGSLAATSYQISWNLPDSGVAGRENPVQGLIASWSLTWFATA